MYKKQVKDKDYIPNYIPTKKRIEKLILIIVLLAYGGYGLFKGELYLAYRQGEVTLYGNAIYIAFSALIVGIAYLALGIIDHYDKRNNEHVYRRFEAILKGFAVLILLTAIFANYISTIK
ncbi:hypothetical protein GCM10008107_27580 [Psychrosphaera saromensis]|uniref:Uncharacterized protein n=1 Tax=Psychrosphaera saromensis TaxID=716813 RepID=A0A2S7UVT4_9GAMM|nr:hypothetical protein [Psychrosphaera saromensis]PQJ54063.1 hypothetical protein BTO11_10650 [Psychrosphaera saromensis]GHB76547.1 hypothetical protein GCM10008107_27580 [Psychrosphaera saromensis]GLQ14439.1 hypothetical protein GCM10007917_18940 [Psychrosphaera saromensis]